MVISRKIYRAYYELCKRRDFVLDAGRRLCGMTNQESVYFYTFHKCASALFSQFLLKKAQGLRHIDYAKEFFEGFRTKAATFSEKGYIYGPIRMGVRAVGPVHDNLTKYTMTPDFVREKQILFMVRDPRDILVSSYYSFGYSHPTSLLKPVRALQEKRRERISAQTVDEFALRVGPSVLDPFHLFMKLVRICPQNVVLRYEDMIENFDVFAQDLTRLIALRNKIVKKLYRKTRPREKESLASHHRSGRTGGFRDKLKPETIQSLNDLFGDVLAALDYTP